MNSRQDAEATTHVTRERFVAHLRGLGWTAADAAAEAAQWFDITGEAQRILKDLHTGTFVPLLGRRKP